ncbi:MAG: hypothetical protein ACPG45_00275 [Flavobacteriaceae bacterium]
MKRQIVLIAVLSILLVSCGGSSWSCKKRYCDVDNIKIDITKTKPELLKKTILVKS